MTSKKWLLIIPLATVFSFAFSYIYAVYYRIPALSRDGSWLSRAGISVEPMPTLEEALSAETAARMERATDPKEKEKWTRIRTAAETEINAAHGEGLLIALLALNVVWMPMIYRWRRKRLARGRMVN
jgi:hypothetical protein